MPLHATTLSGNGAADLICSGSALNASNRTHLGNPFCAGDKIAQLARLDGGSSVDTLACDCSGLSFNLATVANQSASNTTGSPRLTSIGGVDRTGSANNALGLGLADLRDLAPFNGLNSSTTTAFGQLLAHSTLTTSGL